MKRLVVLLFLLMSARASVAQMIYVLRGVNLSAEQFERVYAQNVPLATDGLISISGRVAQIISTNMVLSESASGEMCAIVLDAGTDGYVDGHPINAWFRIVGSYDYIAVNAANRRVRKVVPCVPQRVLTREQFVSAVQAGRIDVDLSDYAPRHEPPKPKYFGVQPVRASSAR